MIMTIGMSVTVRNSRLQELIDSIDFGLDEYDEYDAAKLLIYSGTRVATGVALDEYDDAVLLASFDLPFPCGSVVNGVLTFNSVADTIGLVSGLATWARVVDYLGTFIMDMSVTIAGSGGDCQIDDPNILQSGTVKCNSVVITEGNA
jgi:hypothetical protein